MRVLVVEDHVALANRIADRGAVMAATPARPCLGRVRSGYQVWYRDAERKGHAKIFPTRVDRKLTFWGWDMLLRWYVCATEPQVSEVSGPRGQYLS